MSLAHSSIRFGDLPGHEFHGNQWTAGQGGVTHEMRTKADALHAMPPAQRDNVEIHDYGHDAYSLYEAEAMMPKKEGTMKAVNDSNSMVSWQHADAIANINGRPYLATKQEDPDDEDLMVWAFNAPGDKYGKGFTSDWADKKQAIEQFKQHLAASTTKFGVTTMVLKDAEIFQTGSWPGQGAAGMKFTETDLDNIVASFNSLQLAGRVPLKLGHDGADVRTNDSAPALGWVEAVRRSGSKLLADIKLTSEKLAEGIRAGSYKFVSVELLRNVQAHTRQIPWVLDAVALLGATAPAVGTLRDLQTSMQSFSRRSGLRFSGERLAFKREDVNPSTEEDTGMDEAAVQALVAKAVGEATTKFSAQITDLTQKLEVAQTETTKANAKAQRFSVLAPFEAAIKAGVINAAAKDLFVTTNGINDDAKVMLSSAKVAEEFIDSVKDLPKYKGPGSNKRVAMKAAPEDPEALVGKTTAEVVSFRCQEQVLKLGQDVRDFAAMEAANKHVLSTDKHLALQYFADPQAQYEPPTDKSEAA